MPRIRRTRISLTDYDEIWDYIAAHDPAAADRVVDRLDAALHELAKTPFMGRSVEELARNLRSFPVGNYLLFYRTAEDGIELIRAVHGARDISPEYFDDEQQDAAGV